MKLRLRVVSCPQCGASIRFVHGMLSAQCAHCNTAVSQEEIRSIDDHLDKRFPNPTPVRLGMTARFKNKPFEVIGRLVVSMIEEGERYAWNEWELIAPDGDCLFLEYDEGQWKLMETFVPAHPLGPAEIAALGENARIQLGDFSASVTQISRSTIECVQGELTYAARAGNSVQYLDAEAGEKRYCVEWTEDEIEFYRGQRLEEHDVLRALGLTKLAERSLRKKTRKRSWQQLGAVCMISAVFSFIGCLVSCGSGRVIGQGQVPISEITREGVRFGPLFLDPDDAVHSLEIRGAMSEASAWVSAVLEDGDDAELISVQQDFWDESGVEGGEYWHESDLNETTYFVAKGRGPYYVRLYAEQDIVRGSLGNASYELRSGVIYPYYFVVFGVLALLSGIVIYSTKGQS